MRRWLLAAVVVVGASAPERADACEPIFDSSELSYPRFEPPLGARVTADRYTLACDGATCTVTATLAMDVSSATHVILRGKRAHDATYSVDGGAPVADVTMPPMTKQLVIIAKLDLEPYSDGCFRSGISARHPLLGGEHPREIQYPIKLETHDVSQVTALPGWDIVTDHGWDEDRQVTTLWLTPPPANYYAGGPVAMVGVGSGTGNTLRGRFGWELGAPRPWLVDALSIDTDFGSLATLAATAEIVSKAWVLPLSYGGGAGVVMQLSPSVEVGGRAFASVALGPGRTMLSFDVLASGDVSIGLFLGGSL